MLIMSTDSLSLFLCTQLTRPAQDLLMSLCMNCNSHGADDMEVISNLIKIRLKPKVLLNHYMLCVRSVASLFVWLLTCSYVHWPTLTSADSPGSCSTRTETTWPLWWSWWSSMSCPTPGILTTCKSCTQCCSTAQSRRQRWTFWVVRIEGWKQS